MLINEVITKTSSFPYNIKMLSFFEPSNFDCLSFNLLSEEKRERLDMIVEDFMVPQYRRGLKEAINKYENSGLPLKYIKNSDFYIIAMGSINGIFDGYDIWINANSISSIDLDSSFVVGHEVGHKILYIQEKNNPNNYNSFLDEIESLTGISKNAYHYYENGRRFHFLKEFICDEIGSLVAGNNNDYIFNFEEDLRNRVRRKIMSISHK